ncbi:MULTISPECIES: nucleotide exchange factor GrpE [unclassified Kitasatospora]
MSDEAREPARRAEDPVGAEPAGQGGPADDATPGGVEAPATGGPTERPAGVPVLPELDVEELRDRWQRAVAETQNLRKRYERELAQAGQVERDRVTAAWLPVLDHLELALHHAAADPHSIVAGVQAVCRQAYAVLEQLGYRRIAEPGEPFDPARHEAAQVRPDSSAPPGSILEVLRAGYDSDNGLLRPAVVSVAAKAQE